MYQKICKWCKEEISVEKQSFYALHVSNCKSNPRSKENKFKGIQIVERITLKKVCPKCNEEFEVTATEAEIKRNKIKKCCSIKCSKSNKRTDEQKKKISEINKSSERVKLANRLIGSNRKEENINNYKFTCVGCGETGIDKKFNKNRKYHKECWLKSSGGIRKGSSNGRKGWYSGFWCDSSYELAFLIYCLDNKKKIERNIEGFEYFFDNEIHRFYPDFIVDGEYVEIKNYRSELTDAKITQFPHKITVYYKDTIKPFLEYTIDKYGKDFINLYNMTTKIQQQQQLVKSSD